MTRAQVVETQRMRLMAAAAAVVETSEFKPLSVASLLARAGISRKTFYDVFSDAEACCLMLVEDALARVSEAASAAYQSQDSWSDGMSAAIHTVLTLAEQERGLARLLAAEAPAYGPKVMEARSRALRELAEIIDHGRVEAGGLMLEAGPMLALGISHGLAALLYDHLVRKPKTPLVRLRPAMMSLVVLPYLGRAAAKDELGKPPPPDIPSLPAGSSRAASSMPPADMLARLKLRLTYRTARVVAAIAEYPDANNRRLGELAEIVDQGQVSKLLNRLERLDLIVNSGGGAAQGTHNSWSLTPLGVQLYHLLTARSLPPRKQR